MKPVLSLLVLAGLCACSRPASPPEAAAPDAAQSAPAHETAMTAEREAPPQDHATPAAPSPAPAPVSDAPAAPAANRGIAVGEPHPSGSVPIDAGPARYDGYGDLRFGMPVDAARKAWKGTLKGDDVAPGNCAYLSPAGTAAGPYLMFENARFVRYDVRGANTVAPGGGRVGMAADDIRRLYAGRVGEEPHKYEEGGKYLRIADPASKSHALLFEVDRAGRVTTWRAGQTPQVDYVEGCG